MRSIVSAGLIAGLLTAAPAAAADLAPGAGPALQRTGSFAGARLRLSLGGERAEGRLRAGFVVAPTMRTDRADGSTFSRFGEGLEFGVADRRPAALSIGGMALTGDDHALPSGPRAGVSTLGWIAIGIASAAVIVVGATALCLSDSECNPSE